MKEIMMERRSTKADEWRVSDAAGGGVTWKAASQAQSSRAGIVPFVESEVGVNREGSLGDPSSVRTAETSQKKAQSSDKERTLLRRQEYGTCLAKDMEVDNDKSFGGCGFLSSARLQSFWWWTMTNHTR